MADTAPAWLKTMRDITGLKEKVGTGNNPTIMAWVDEIGRRFPALASYARTYNADSIPWCGHGMAYVMATNGIRPVDGYLWAQNWNKHGSKLAKPRLGCVMVFTRDGGGHVALYEGEDDTHYHVRGANQSDSVSLARYQKENCIGYRWPLAVVDEPKSPTRFTDITATVFSDAVVAYSDVAPGYVDRPGVALPYRFSGKRPGVRVHHGGYSVDCEVADVGPWNTNDPYFYTNKRPAVEAQFQARTMAQNGRIPTNDAGIDLTPAAAKALRLVGKGKVDWEFVGAVAKPPVKPPVKPKPKPPIGPPAVVGVGTLAALSYWIDTHPHIVIPAMLLIVGGFIAFMKWRN